MIDLVTTIRSGHRKDMKIHKRESNLIFPWSISLFTRNICQVFFCVSNLLIKGHVFDRLVYVHGRLGTIGDHRKLWILPKFSRFALLSCPLKSKNVLELYFNISGHPEAITLKRIPWVHPVSVEDTRRKIYSDFIFALYLGQSLVWQGVRDNW